MLHMPGDLEAAAIGLCEAKIGNWRERKGRKTKVAGRNTDGQMGLGCLRSRARMDLWNSLLGR